MKTKIIFLFCLCMCTFQSFAQYTASAPISLSSKSNMTISGKSFTTGTNGISIFLSGCSNIRITNCNFQLNSTIIAIQLQNCSNIEIDGNIVKNFRTGVYATNCTGGINIHCNSFKDIAGAVPRGQMVQFNGCKGAGNRVNYNILDHTFGIGNPEDLINMYASSGTSADPLQIIGNKLRGGGPSTTGGGIMVGDNGGHDVIVSDNILVDPGQYGIGVPAGYNITVKNNKIFAQKNAWTNVGLYVGLAGEIAAGFPCTGNSIRVEGNQVNWTNKNGIKNGWYNCSCCPGVTNLNNNFNAPITSSILPSTLTLNSVCGTTPDPVNIAPTVTLTSPANNSSYVTPATITISATASDVDGTITKVEFYQGTTLLFSDAVAPYSYSWTAVTAGTYNITAKAFDNNGASKTTSLITIIVTTPTTATTKGLNGISCLTAGKTYTYTVEPESNNYGNISFWSNSAAVITQDASDKKKMTIQIPSHMNGSSFTLYSGVNYSTSPWYKEYTKTIKVGGCNARLEAALSPNPTENSSILSLNNNIKIISVIVYNGQGTEVQQVNNIESDRFELGSNLAAGLYTVIIQSEEGVTSTLFLKR